MEKKKTTRKKAYKFMSVSELVAARKELTIKMEEIDSILGKAVEVFNGVKPPTPNNYNNNYYSNLDPAFKPSNSSNINRIDQVAISTEAPIMAPIPANAPDQSSGFSIFDAEAFAQQQGKAEEEYLAQHPSAVVENVDFNFDNSKIEKEIENLKQGIANSISNV